MKKLIIIIIMGNTILYSNAQHPWAQSGAMWYYTAHYCCLPDPVDGYDKFEKIGDTVVGGKLCDNIYESFLAYNWQFSQWDSSHSNTFTYLSNDTVFYWMNNQFWIYAIYSAQVGDTWNFARDTSFCHDSCYFHVDSLGQKIIGIDTFPVWFLTAHNYYGTGNQVPFVFTKKIGFDFTMFPLSECLIDVTQWGPFRCYSDSTGFSYASDNAPYCDFTIDVGNIPNPPLLIEVFPNPSNGVFTLVYNLSSPKSEFKIMDISGREVYKECIIEKKGNEEIRVNNLGNGIYFYQIKNERETVRGNFVIEK